MRRHTKQKTNEERNPFRRIKNSFFIFYESFLFSIVSRDRKSQNLKFPEKFKLTQPKRKSGKEKPKILK